MDLTEELREFREQRHRTNELAATTIEFLQAELQEAQRQRDELLALNAEVMAIAKDALTWCSERDKYHIYSRELERIEAAIARARSGEQGGGEADPRRWLEVAP